MIVAIGDIHGQCTKLHSLLVKLEEAGVGPSDMIVFLGDYIDRGPDTKGVLDTLLEMEATRPNTIFLRGNHEQMILDARERFDQGFCANNPLGTSETGLFWFTEGAKETLRSYEGSSSIHWCRRIPEQHWQFMVRTRMQFELSPYLFVHAGIVPARVVWTEFDGIPVDPRLWIRDQFIGSTDDFGGRIVVFGHTPTRDGLPAVFRNKIGIDTGAGYGGPLTAVVLPSPYDIPNVNVIQA
jgi:serine/threonine protein phosphatase 1